MQMTNPNAAQIKIELVNGREAAPIVNPFYVACGWINSAASDSDTFVIAYADNEIVGCVRFCIDHDIYMLRTMMVHPDYRKQRLGHKILSFYEDKLLKDLPHEVFCLAYTHLGDFYKQIGFEAKSLDSAPQFLIERSALYKSEGNPCIFMVRPANR